MAPLAERTKAEPLTAAAVLGMLPAGATPEAVRATLKQALAAERARIRAAFDAGGRGLTAAKGTAAMTDAVVGAVFDHAIGALPKADPKDAIALVAVGGYGRGQMAPFSDVDLLFLLPRRHTAASDKTVEFILHILWDLGLKVGHASRTVDESVRLAREDVTIRTAVLDARFLCGAAALFADLRKRYQADVVDGTGPAFVEAKLAERNDRHVRLGDSRYMVEPNIKDGKGSLRDLHTLYWIAKYLYGVETPAELVGLGVFDRDEYQHFAKAENFLWTVRFRLHLLANRAEERLTFDVQGEIAQQLGYRERAGARAIERFMKHYFLVAKDVGDLTRIFCAVLEETHKRKPLLRLPKRMRTSAIEGFTIESGRVDVATEDLFATAPVTMLRLFHLAQELGADIHPHALRLVTQNLGAIDAGVRHDPEAARLFLEMLTSRKDPETTLRRLNEAGVFGRYLPDFGRVVAQMQHDMYHVYTVDEHSIRAIGMLAKLESGELTEDHPLASEVIPRIVSRRVLYLSVLLHDIAKGRGGDHSVLGADVAKRVGPLLGFTPEETETVAWLVLRHLDLSRTAFRRDVHDPKTIDDFATLVQSPERLRLLLVLTVVDIRAVGPGRWNSWSGQLMRDLYYATEQALTGGESLLGASRQRVANAKAALAEKLADWPAPDRAAYLTRFYDAYWLGFDVRTLEQQARFVRDATAQKLAFAVGTQVDLVRGVTDVTVYAPDYSGLFAGVAGAMALSGANIVNARVVTTTDGMAIESLWVQGPDGAAIDEPTAIAALKNNVAEVLTGKLYPARALKQRAQPMGRMRVFTVPPRVLIDNAASETYTIIEVNGRDRRGLLYAVTRALSDTGVSIASARIATYGERAVDVFYVRDLIGHKIISETRLAKIRDRLLAALTDGAEPAPTPKTQAAR